MDTCGDRGRRRQDLRGANAVGSRAVSAVARVAAPAVPSPRAAARARPAAAQHVEAVEPRTLFDSTVVFNEIMYNPTGGGTEWVELHNQMAVDMDVSGWSLRDGIDYTFPANTIIKGGGKLVVAANPSALAAATGFSGAFGPFAGALSNGGERLRLYSHNQRLMDEVEYGDGTDPYSGWPVGPDEGGASLAKVDADAGSADPASWGTSAAANGTPGATNVVAPAAALSGLAFEEAGAAGAGFFVELANRGTAPVAIGGGRVVTSAAASFTLPAQTLNPGARVAFTAAELGFTPAAGDKLFLYAPGGALLDGVVVDARTRGRLPGDAAARWLYPSAPTPGAANAASLTDAVVINEVMYHHARTPGATAGALPTENAEEWVELYNRSGGAVDLSGWRLAQGVSYTIPAGTTLGPDQYLVVAKDAASVTAAFPAARVIGNFTGSLANSGEAIALLDTAGNPADEVRYFDGGRWAAYADGGGASLELRDPDADNSKPEAWAASDELGKSAWRTVTYRGVAANGVNDPTRWSEFVFGLLDAGEILIDDINVVERPGQANARQLISNGSFEGGTAAPWRVIGSHKGSVVADPSNPANRVLRVVATDETDTMHNHAEVTLANGAVITNGVEYEISFRARWVAGSNLLNTRLWFNRLGRTTALPVPTNNGTPGARNSRYEANVGPTFSDFRHGPLIPQAGQAVTVTATAADRDGVASATLRYRVNDGPWANVNMVTTGGAGQFIASVPGQAAGAIVQFYVVATDGLGAQASFPARGENSRALYKVADGTAPNASLHDLRILMTPADTTLLHAAQNVMSNDPIGGTVIYDDRLVYYDVGVRLKSSERGRAQDTRVGFNVVFGSDQPFRGVHNNIAIDRSGGTSGRGSRQDEIAAKQIIQKAGGLPGAYDDLVNVIAPKSVHSGPAILQMARYDNNYLDSQFEDGADGLLFDFDLIYYPTTADANGLKFPEPDQVSIVDLQDLGSDEDLYRWRFTPSNNRDVDDFSTIIETAKMFGNLSGAAFDARSKQLLDVDEWLRYFALLRLVGPTDTLGAGGGIHNVQFYVRPTDGKVVIFPHDWDFAWTLSTTASLLPDGNVAKLVTLPGNLHAFYGHVKELLDTSFNPASTDDWVTGANPQVTSYPSLLGQNWAGVQSYIQDRYNYARGALPAQVPFQVTTNGGNPFSTGASSVTLAGDGWVDVRTIRVDGRAEPLAVTWTDVDSWQAQVALAPGANPLTLRAFDAQGNPVGVDSVTITSTTSGNPVVDAIRVTEVNYNPAPAPDAPAGSPFAADPQLFEFVELVNYGSQPVSLQSARFTAGVPMPAPGLGAVTLQPGQAGVIVKDEAAFRWRYGQAPLVLGTYGAENLSNGGELLTFVDAAGNTVQSFTYDDEGAWPTSPDGGGATLVVIDPASRPDLNLPASWHAGRLTHGTPGVNEVADTTPPAVASGSFAHAGPRHAVSVTFTEPLAAAPAAAALAIVDRRTGVRVDPAWADVSYDPAARTATWAFARAPAGGRLPDGDYRATVLAGSVADAAGNPLAADAAAVDLYALAGDANRDRRVDVADLGILATHYGRTAAPAGPAGWGLGDFNGDGAVDVADLGLLATSYGRDLDQPPPPPALAAAASPPAVPAPALAAEPAAPPPAAPAPTPAPEPAPKPAPKPAAPAPKPVAAPASKPVTRPAAKPAAKPSAKPAPKPAVTAPGPAPAKPAAAKPSPRPAPAVAKPAVTKPVAPALAAARPSTTSKPAPAPPVPVGVTAAKPRSTVATSPRALPPIPVKPVPKSAPRPIR